MINMKKIQLLILTLFIGFSALGQQTYFNATPPGTTSLTGLQYRYKSIVPDSLNELYMFWNGKYNRMFTGTEQLKRFAPITGGSYVPLSRIISTNGETGLLGGGNLGSNLSLSIDTAGVLTTKTFFYTHTGTSTQAQINALIAAGVKTVSTLSELQDYSGTSNVVIWTDSLRGGVFNYYPLTVGYDNGIKFQATGKGIGVWGREFDGKHFLPEWWGAKADGATNSTVPINLAATAAGYAKGIVSLGGGDYLVRRAQDTSRTIIQIPTGASMVGSGRMSTRIINDPTTTPNTASPTYATMIVRTGSMTGSSRDIGLYDFTIVGNSSIINAGQASVSPIRGAGNVLQAEALSDTTQLLTWKCENITIKNIGVIDTYNSIQFAKSIRGAAFTELGNPNDYFNNILVEGNYINGVFNRAIEFTLAKNFKIINNTLYGAGFIHLLKNCFNWTIAGNYINFGGDTYSFDRQGYTAGSTLDAGGIYLNYSVHHGNILNNIVEANPGLPTSVTTPAALYIRYEPNVPSSHPAMRYIFTNGNTWTNAYGNKQVIGVSSSSSNYIKAYNFIFSNDTFNGSVALIRSGQSYTNTNFRDWIFDNCTIDSVSLPRKSLTAGSGNFSFINNSTINKAFNTQATRINLVNSYVANISVPSTGDSLTVDNSRYGAISINASAINTVFKNMPYLITTATNAATTLNYANQIVNLPVITANRILTPPSSSVYAGQTIIVNNGNTAAFTWSFAASTAYTANGTNVTAMRNNATYTLTSNGDGTWRIVSVADGTYNGTGIPVATGSPTFTGTVTTPAIAITSVASGTAGTDSVLVKSSTTNLVRKIAASYYVPSTRTITINGTAFDLSANRTWTVGTVTGGTINWPGALYTTPTTGSVGSGTLTFAPSLATQSANTILAGPTTGSAAAPAFRSLVAADIPSLSSTYLPLSGGTTTGTISNAFYTLGETAGSGRTKFGNATTYISNFNADGTQDAAAAWRFVVGADELQLRYQPSLPSTRFTVYNGAGVAQGSVAYTSDTPTMLRLTGSGTGAATTIVVPHMLNNITSSSIVLVQPINAASAGVSYVTIDALNVNIVYTVAPVLGSSNLQYNVSIKP